MTKRKRPHQPAPFTRVCAQRITEKEGFQTVSTGYLDYMLDELEIFLIPDKKLVTDAGYTEFKMNALAEYQDTIHAHGLVMVPVKQTKEDGKTLITGGDLLIHYTSENDKQEKIDKMRACILAIYKDATKDFFR